MTNPRTVQIPLHGKHAGALNRHFVLVDAADVPNVAPYRWRIWMQVNAAGTRSGPYAVTTIPNGTKHGDRVVMHQLLNPGWKRVEHRNGDGLDNTRKNMREATPSQNGANRGKRRTGGTSRYKGVRQIRSGSWQARIKVDYVQWTIGSYPTEELAARAYDAVALKAWGDFARLNLPGVVGKPLPPPNYGGRRQPPVNGHLPADLAGRLSPELQATLGEIFPGSAEGGE